jgi:hypothetical protein
MVMDGCSDGTLDPGIARRLPHFPAPAQIFTRVMPAYGRREPPRRTRSGSVPILGIKPDRVSSRLRPPTASRVLLPSEDRAASLP